MIAINQDISSCSFVCLEQMLEHVCVARLVSVCPVGITVECRMSSTDIHSPVQEAASNENK